MWYLEVDTTLPETKTIRAGRDLKDEHAKFPTSVHFAEEETGAQRGQVTHRSSGSPLLLKPVSCSLLHRLGGCDLPGQAHWPSLPTEVPDNLWKKKQNKFQRTRPGISNRLN